MSKERHLILIYMFQIWKKITSFIFSLSNVKVIHSIFRLINRKLKNASLLVFQLPSSNLDFLDWVNNLLLIIKLIKLYEKLFVTSISFLVPLKLFVYGWQLFLLYSSVFYLKYDTKLHPMVRLQFWSIISMWVPIMGYIDLSNDFKEH